MISIPAFFPSLPKECAWIETHDWNAANCFDGYKKLYDTVNNLSHLGEYHHPENASIYALGRWFNRLLIELFDDDGEKTNFISRHPPSSINPDDIELFLAFILGARRTVITGMFSEGFDWELSDQTELTRRWPSAWYAQHMLRAMDMRVPDMHIHTVPFFQDYNDGLSCYKEFFNRSVAQIAAINETQKRAQLLLGILVNRPIPFSEKVAILHRVVDESSDAVHTWEWIGHFIINGHLGNQVFCSGYEQLMKQLLAPSNPHSHGNLAHPALPESMAALERLWEIEKDSPIPLLGYPELYRLGCVILDVCTLNSRDLAFIDHMKTLEIQPWQIFDALLNRDKQGGVSSPSIELPPELC